MYWLKKLLKLIHCNECQTKIKFLSECDTISSHKQTNKQKKKTRGWK